MEKYEVEDVKSHLVDYLNSQGIDTRKMFRCISPDHEDRTPSMNMVNDKLCHCFGCGVTYNIFDVIGIVENLDKKQAFKKALEYYGDKSIKPVNNYKPKEINKNKEAVKDYSKAYYVWARNFNNNSKAENYITSRGISLDTAKRFKIGYNNFTLAGNAFEAVVLPINKNAYTARNIDKDSKNRYFRPENCSSGIFNLSALENVKPYCFITEGEFDCLSFEEIGANSISLNGATNIVSFKDKINVDKKYILALDNDFAGNKAKQNLIDYFLENKIEYGVFDNEKHKDVNQFLIDDRYSFECKTNIIINEIMKHIKDQEIN